MTISVVVLPCDIFNGLMLVFIKRAFRIRLNLKGEIFDIATVENVDVTNI